jgi:1,6-anhydro-N-acetylmuramate kinase
VLQAFIGLMSGTSVDAVDGVLAVYEAQTADAQVLRARCSTAS